MRLRYLSQLCSINLAGLFTSESNIGFLGGNKINKRGPNRQTK